MSPRPSDAPQRVIDAAAQMLARVGLNATSIREVTKLAEAPLGSTYHHFPGGKQELLARATHMAGDKVEALLVFLVLSLLVERVVDVLEHFAHRKEKWFGFRAGIDCIKEEFFLLGEAPGPPRPPAAAGALTPSGRFREHGLGVAQVVQ